MLTVGLTGGLACGKTFIAQELARFGCHIIFADLLGHDVLAPQGEAYPAVVARWGNAILTPDRTIDRSSLAHIVFHDAQELEALNAIIHPAVRRREEQLIKEFAAADPHGIVVVEAAILIEAGLHERFDFLVVAACDPELQLARALARHPETPQADIEARLEHQMPLEEKRKLADFLIDTSGSEASTLEQTRQLYQFLHKMATTRAIANLGQ